MDSLKRIDLLKNWVSKKLQIDFSISTASSDASFRRYFRVKTVEDSFIVMDAPPQNESIEAFLKISQILNSINVNVPDIYEEDEALGFILMQDFGSDTYLDVLNDDNQQRLYSDSIESLIQMQKLVKKNYCQSYTQKILFDEMNLFVEWYLKKYKKIELTNRENQELLTCFEEISKKDKKKIKKILATHYKLTKSKRAEMLIQNFESISKDFIRIVPKEIHKLLEAKGMNIDDFDFVNPNLN